MKKKKKMWKKQCCTQFTIFIVLMIFFFWLWGEIWAGCRTWRWGLLLTSRNPVEFPDCEEALLTHCLFCWESDDELLRQAVGGALPARCKAALFPLAEQSQYISSLTNNVEVSVQSIERTDREPSKKTLQHIHLKTARGGLIHCMYVLICDSWDFICVDVFRGNTSLSCLAFWMHALWFLTFHFPFNALTSHESL